MPPKAKKADGPSKKTEQKKKEKVIEDKTFGLKNKKGSKQQKFIKTVVHQVKNSNTKLDELNKPKDGKKKELDELNKLFKPVQVIGKGVDPKSVLCAFFKQGQCSKGEKCKFSHDLNITRKSEKKSVYDDVRDEDSMENWDEQKLEEVVNKKHAESDKSKPKTSIICKFFLEAVENSKYGWFWTCPNGGNECMYKHCLPPGFQLKKDQKKADKTEQISIEELVEKERMALGLNTTRVTLETFLKWKERKKREKIAAMLASQDKKKSAFKDGKLLGISGREMFEFNPELIGGDDEEASDTEIQREDDDDDEEEEAGAVKSKYKDISDQIFVPTEVDQSGTQCTPHATVLTNGTVGENEASKMDEAGALPPPGDGSGDTTETDAAIAMAMAATKGGDMNIEIDEDLFDGEDLDLIEDDLETLDLDE